jgi:hypothetical protein
MTTSQSFHHGVLVNVADRAAKLVKLPLGITVAPLGHVFQPRCKRSQGARGIGIWRRKVSLAVHVAHADKVLRGQYGGRFILGMDAFSCHGVFTHAMGRKRLRISLRGA